MEVMAVKTEPSDYTELGDPRGLLDEVSHISLKRALDQPPDEYGSTCLIAADSTSITLRRNSIGIKTWFGDESKDLPTSGDTKVVPCPKSLPSRSAAKRECQDFSGDSTICTGLPHQVDPVVPKYEADPHDSGDVILNDPLKPDPDEPSADYGLSFLDEADSIKSNALPGYDEVTNREPHNEPCMDIKDSCDPEYDDVAEDSAKILDGEKPFACDVCDYRAAKRRNLKRHMATHPGKKPYACRVCDYRAALSSTLKSHMATHTGEKLHACDLCDYRAVHASHLKRHRATHTGEKPFVCNACDYRAANEWNIKRHMVIHTGEKPHACDECDFRTTLAYTLKTHIMETHPGKKPYACRVCDYRAALSSTLKSHMATHTGEKLHACDLCDYRAVHASRLKRHRATHTGEKPYACGLCDYRAIQTTHLKRHMATHTGENLYACGLCDFRAVHASRLKRHRATHTGEKLYACGLCDFRAVHASRLKRHRATHTGDKPYACKVCDYRAAQASNLGRHMATHCGKEALDDSSGDTGMISSDTVSTSKADQLMYGPPHRVGSVVAHDKAGQYELSADISLNDPLKLEPGEPSTDDESRCSVATDSLTNELLLDHDEVMTDWVFEADSGLCDPLEVAADKLPCAPLQLHLTEPLPDERDPHQLPAVISSNVPLKPSPYVTSCDIIKMEQYELPM